MQELAVELDRQAKTKRDLLVTTDAMHMDASDTNVALQVGTLDNHEEFNINEIAHRQIGSQLKIPAIYYDRMKAENPRLLAANVNSWFGKDSQTRMLRTLDGTARAFLSDRYRRIDNLEVAQAVLPIIGDMEGARIESCEMTESRMYIKVVNERLTLEVTKGDIVQAGIVISNSEVGMGSVNVRPLIYRLVCSNGMIAADAGVRKYHVGRVNESTGDEFGIFRNETIEADDKAFMMKIEDTVRAAIDEAKFGRIVGKLRDATEAKMEAIVAPSVVELASKEYGFNEHEGAGILGHLISGGDLSLYGLANAVTRQAQDVNSYDRATELEGAGWKITNMPAAIWRQITKGKA